MTTSLLSSQELRARKARSEAAQLGYWTRRVIIAWHNTTEDQRQAGVEWYDDAYMTLAALDPENPERAVGVAAPLSVQTSWKENVEAARLMLHAADNGLPVPNVNFPAMRAQAARIAFGASPLDVLQGPKIRNFYANIMGNDQVVTVDRWAVRVATGRDMKDPPKGRVYDRLALAYIRASDKVGVAPRTVQAATWVAARGSAV